MTGVQTCALPISLVLHKRNEEALLASRKYLIYTLISGQLFLAGLVAVYCISGTMDFKAGGFLTTDMAPTWQLQLIFLIMILAGSVKAALNIIEHSDNTEEQKIKLLKNLRFYLLDDIHFKQQLLDNVDYSIYQLRHNH